MYGKYKMKSNRESRNALIALVMGDGYLEKNGACVVSHSIYYEEYVQWKVKFLKSVGLKCSFDTIEKPCPMYKMYISVTKFGKLLRHIMYKNNTKSYFSRKLLNRLEAVHIAMLYMDKGCISSKKKDGVVYKNELIINTHTTKENNQILIDYFKEEWDVQFGQVFNRGSYRLKCGTKEARKFISIVEPFASQVSCMRHKLNVKSS